MARKATNNLLQKAKKSKNDEFYTQFSDIEKELQYYKSHFENKIVYCNCDDPHTSNFFKYFVSNFKELRLKKVIAACYAEKGFFAEYIDYYNRCSALTRLLNKEVLKNTFAIYESKLKDLKNNTEKFNQCFLLYNQRKLKQCYIQTISNQNNYIEDKEIQLFMEDYLNLGRVDIYRFIEGKKPLEVRK